MKQQGNQGGITLEDRKVFLSCYYVFFVNGGLALILGAMLPHIRESYQLSYQLAGLLISFHSIGNLISSFIGGIIPVYIGRKKSIVLLSTFGVVAFCLMVTTGNPYVLLLAFFFTGINRGAISNFNNAVINDIATGKAWALNILHSVFAIGAFTAPFVVLFYTRNHSGNWKYAALTWAFLCLTEVIILCIMKVPNNHPTNRKEKKDSWGFLKEKPFILACCILFFYMCSEQAINGWLVTYFRDSGIMSDTFAQTMSSLLWIIILLGRLLCAYLSQKIDRFRLLIISSIGYLIFFIILLINRQLSLITIGIIGVGFCMAGLYPTVVASVGEIMKSYPFALSFLLTVAGIGSIVMPSIIGGVADWIGIVGGMSLTVVAVASTFIFICLYARYNNGIKN